LWATDTEYEQVKTLLAKLGEQGGAGAVRGNLRILSLPSRSSEQALESLQQIWPHLRSNPLEIRGRGVTSGASSSRETESSSTDKAGEPRSENRTASAERSKTSDSRASRVRRAVLPKAITVADTSAGESTDEVSAESGEEVAFVGEVAEIETLAQVDQPTEPKAAEKPTNIGPQEKPANSASADQAVAKPAAAADQNSPRGSDDAKGSTPAQQSGARLRRNAAGQQLARSDASQPSPITISEGPGGQLIVTSEDIDALDAFEKLIAQVTPKQADYEVFRLQYASPYAIELTLSQIFGLDSLTGIGSRGSSSLPIGSRPTLSFISDVDTGTLLVQGASAEQLQKIAELIDLYDQPESHHKDLLLKTEIYVMRFSRAEAVAEVV
jgi:hypothetical protein